MQEELVKLAEEKEYNKFHPLWFENNIIEPKSWFMELCLLQKWIRDTHNIHISINSLGQCNYHLLVGFVGNILTKGNNYSTYEEALEKGLQEALNLIPNNK